MTTFLKFCAAILGLLLLVIVIRSTTGGDKPSAPDPKQAAQYAEYKRDRRNDAIVELSRFLGSPRDVEFGADRAQECVNTGKKWSECGPALDVAIIASPHGRLTTDEMHKAVELERTILANTDPEPTPAPTADPLADIHEQARTEAARLLATNPPPFELNTRPLGYGAIKTGDEIVDADETNGIVTMIDIPSIKDVQLAEPLGQASTLTVYHLGMIRASDGKVVLSNWGAVDCKHGLMWSALQSKNPDGSVSWDFLAPGLPTMQEFPAAYKAREFVCGHRPVPR